MAGKVISLKPKRGAADTILGSAFGPGEPPLYEKLVGALHSVPASVLETPYEKLPAYLVEAVRRSHGYRGQIGGRAKAGRTAPKPANLTRLLTAARSLKDRLKAVPREHRKLVVERMVRVGMERNNRNIALAAPYKHAAEAMRDCDIDILVELLVSGLASLCEDPRPLSESQARIAVRKYSVLSIRDALRRADKPIDGKRLTAIARALAAYFPAEAVLHTINPSTVRDIIKTKNRT